MSDAVVLDTTPLGLLCHPRNPPQVVACRQWVDDLLVAGCRVVIPEISDYEIRRELLLRGSAAALANLENLLHNLEFLPLSTASMRHAAELWAQVRRIGKPTAPQHSLDGDVILAAQALSLQSPVIVATENPKHISRFVTAESWTNIKP